VSTTGGATSTEGPTLDIKAEDAADTSMNLVLIGGPVANTLTSDLVENGKSTVDWYNSDGDIEVISSAFKSGKYGIIVAGKDRTATADAAKAVAGEL
jgi:S-layer protein (TIGR01564 family)